MSFRLVFAHAAFATFWTGRIAGTTATLMQSVALGWLVYASARMELEIKESLFLVGMLGLAQFLPMFLLALVAGAVADHHDRRRILLVCSLVQLSCALGFAILSLREQPSLTAIFGIAAIFGAARAFEMPARMSLAPALVPREVLPMAIAWSTLGMQIGMIAGPWLGGMLSAISTTLAIGGAGGLYLLAALTAGRLLAMPIDARPRHAPGTSRLVMIREGLIHLRDSRIVLGAISLDLFAVLLGGVTALLPAYAKEILATGPEGLGWLRTMFAVGAGAMTLTLAFRPIRRHAGPWILGGVAVYGAATLTFALATQLPLSMLALMLAGAADSVSVFVRQNLVQIVTPDAMRGRIAAVSGLFISASNELGEFESGVVARFLGLVGSAVFGGIGALAVTGLWAGIFPELRRADRLEPPE
ncbi:MAG: MFS transporter [Magnetococcales bacterium]|nr:MFS transporter [Magnetococcales bacterium]